MLAGNAQRRMGLEANNTHGGGRQCAAPALTCLSLAQSASWRQRQPLR